MLSLGLLASAQVWTSAIKEGDEQRNINLRTDLIGTHLKDKQLKLHDWVAYCEGQSCCSSTSTRVLHDYYALAKLGSK